MISTPFLWLCTCRLDMDLRRRSRFLLRPCFRRNSFGVRISDRKKVGNFIDHLYPQTQNISHGIFANIYHKNQPNVGKYTSPMDPMGIESSIRTVHIYTSLSQVLLSLVFGNKNRVSLRNFNRIVNFHTKAPPKNIGTKKKNTHSLPHMENPLSKNPFERKKTCFT